MQDERPAPLTYRIVVHPLYRWRRFWRVLNDAREIHCGPRVDVQIWATD